MGNGQFNQCCAPPLQDEGEVSSMQKAADPYLEETDHLRSDHEDESLRSKSPTIKFAVTAVDASDTEDASEAPVKEECCLGFNCCRSNAVYEPESEIVVTDDPDEAEEPLTRQDRSVSLVDVVRKITGSLDELLAAVEGMAGKPSRHCGLLGPVVRNLEEAAQYDDDGDMSDLLKAPLLNGFDDLADALDTIGGGMGSYLRANVTKLRKSSAPSKSTSYKEWLSSELPVHAATGYKGYVDESAWMGNVWLTWTLEFFVEMYSELSAGRETRASADAAYARTLKNHHNYFQSVAFGQAVKKLPNRKAMFAAMRTGGATEDDVTNSIEEFVNVGRPVVQYCLQANEDMETILKQAQLKYRR